MIISPIDFHTQSWQSQEIKKGKTPFTLIFPRTGRSHYTSFSVIVPAKAIAWEIALRSRVGVRSTFSAHRCESWHVYITYGADRFSWERRDWNLIFHRESTRTIAINRSDRVDIILLVVVSVCTPVFSRARRFCPANLGSPTKLDPHAAKLQIFVDLQEHSAVNNLPGIKGRLTPFEVDGKRFYRPHCNCNRADPTGIRSTSRLLWLWRVRTGYNSSSRPKPFSAEWKPFSDCLGRCFQYLSWRKENVRMLIIHPPEQAVFFNCLRLSSGARWEIHLWRSNHLTPVPNRPISVGGTVVLNWRAEQWGYS